MTGAPAPTTVLLLGPFAARNGKGDGLALPKKGKALLAFLLRHRARQVARDDLAALLWSNTGSKEARHSLRQCLSVLRRIVPDTACALLVRDDTLTLHHATGLTSDVETVERLERCDSVRDLAEADALYRGDFLAGLSLPGEPFDEWAANERQRLSEARLRILTNLARLYAEADDLTRAVETARRLTALDPLREESSRLLMELLVANGQRGLALVEHSRIERKLREELQLQPDPATRRFAESLRRGRPFEQQLLSLGARTQGSAAGPLAGAPAPRPHHALSGQPIVAVLPIANLTGEPSQDHFARCLTEDVACALGSQRWLVVVVPTTSAVDLCKGVGKYVARASIRRDAARVRLVARLTDASQGRQLWSAKVEAETNSLFALHDRLCSQLVTRLAGAVRTIETQEARHKPAELLSPYELYLRASAIYRRSPAANDTALDLLRRAIQLEPEFAAAYALTTRILHVRRLMGWSGPEGLSRYDVIALVHRALQIDSGDPEVLWMCGLALANLDGNLRDGEHLVDRSLTINPNEARAWIGSSFIRARSGDAVAALDHFHRAEQLEPEGRHRHHLWHAAAMAHFVAARYEEANAATDRALAYLPSFPASLRLKVAGLGLLGQRDAAREAAQRLVAVSQDITITTMRAYWKLWGTSTHDAVAAMTEGWRRAGIPKG